MKYYMPSERVLVGEKGNLPSKKGYVFKMQANICFSWVEEVDVATLLSIKKDCNCGNGALKSSFLLANDNDVRQWTNKGGR